MLKWLIRRKLRAFERANGYDASYMHEVLDTDVSAFLKFARATNLNTYRKDVPPDLYYAATLTSSVTADCGPCTQLGVGFALASGVAPSTVAAIIKGDEAAMTSDVALGVRFARAVLAEDAVLYADGGGKRRSVLKPIFGRDRILRYYQSQRIKAGGALSAYRVDPVTLNGLPGFVFHTAEGPETMALEIADGRVVALYLVRNPDKVRHFS